MRREDERSGSLFSYVDLEARVGQRHPLRAIRALVNEAQAALVSDFSYSPIGRPSIPPEKLACAIRGYSGVGTPLWGVDSKQKRPARKRRLITSTEAARSAVQNGLTIAVKI
jgi:hypothetical protein